MESLTFEQNRIFSFIRERVENNSLSPTIREIASEFGYKSPNNVRQHLRLIANKGYIKLLPGIARGIQIAEEFKQYFDENQNRVPLIGTVAAGKPITAMENVKGYVILDRAFFKSDNLFTLRIRGDSMEGIGVLDRDIVVVKQQNTAEQRDIVVAVIDGEATLKRYIREMDRVILRAENPNYDDIVIPQGENLWIAGKMVGILRKY